MIDVVSFFSALKATWMNRIMSANPEIHSWAQIPLKYLGEYNIGENKYQFNIDSSVNFNQLKPLPPFYREVFMSYNSALTTEYETFKSNIQNEIIWGNKFITKTYGKKKSVLYLRNWIRSGIVFVSHLRFNDGIVDEKYLYNIIQDKRNIYAEVSMVKAALQPYRESLRNMTHVNHLPEEQLLVKSKQFYSLFVQMKSNHIDRMSLFLLNRIGQFDEKECFNNKVWMEKEIKLKEFNFKLLHGILPCNANLKKWKIKSSDTCDICHQKQTIEHLLFDCDYVQPLWRKFTRTFNTNVSFSKILGANCESHLNSTYSLIAFLIYKEWLLLSLNNKCRTHPISFQYYKDELELRVVIYRMSRGFTENDLIFIEMFIDQL